MRFDPLLHVLDEVGVADRDLDRMLRAVGRATAAGAAPIAVDRDSVFDGDRLEDTVVDAGAAADAAIGDLDRDSLDGRDDLVELRRGCAYRTPSCSSSGSRSRRSEPASIGRHHQEVVHADLAGQGTS
jgi:hypothetical protein